MENVRKLLTNEESRNYKSQPIYVGKRQVSKQ
jgi:hypothetical protein